MPLTGLFRTRRTNLLATCLTGLGLMVTLSACEDSVNPFVEEDRFFSIYGYLDTGTRDQYARVIPLQTNFAEIDDQEIDATVTTTELESGEVQAWTDEVIQFSDGSTGHVFQAHFRPVPGRTYEFKVERSDGVTTTAQTTVPPEITPEIDDPVSGANFALQRVRWPQLGFKPFRVEVWYRFLNPIASEAYKDAILVYDEKTYGQFLNDNSTWEVLIQLTADKEDVADALGISEESKPTLGGIGVRLTMTDGAWRPPDGQFDPEVLVQPGTFSNVQNGFGFFGSLNQFTAEWMVSETVVDRMGYSFPE